jgi:crotonobetainyl-CoA:carnitine CoA-transferase CaiB-like acyl-CoA transferase
MNKVATSAAAGPGPLSGIKVLELGQFIAGPFAGTILGYFGAEVIKVEPLGEGDQLRKFRDVDETGTSYWWYSLGRNKKSICVDLRKEQGQEIVKKLALKSDVLIENFKPGKLVSVLKVSERQSYSNQSERLTIRTMQVRWKSGTLERNIWKK